MEFFNALPHYWIWLGLIIFFIVVEASTAAMVSIWFVVGCLAALFASFFIRSFLYQLLICAVVTALSLIITRPLVRSLRGARHVATGADRNVGRVAQVLTDIQPALPGRVRLDGVDWRATSSAPLKAGEFCCVLKVQGTTLVVTPYEEPQKP